MRTTITILSVFFLGCETNTAGLRDSPDAGTTPDAQPAPDLRPEPQPDARAAGVSDTGAETAEGPEAGPEAAPDTQPTAECLQAMKCCVGVKNEWDCRDLYITTFTPMDCCAYAYFQANSTNVPHCSPELVTMSGCGAGVPAF
jgi:hypothetical protein